MKNGLILAAFHVALILTIGAKFAYERAVLPRGWMRTMPVDPSTPLRGRYVSLRVMAKKEPGYTGALNAFGHAVLTARIRLRFRTRSCKQGHCLVFMSSSLGITMIL